MFGFHCFLPSTQKVTAFMYHSSVGNCIIIYDICSLQAVLASDPLEVNCDSSPCQKEVEHVKVLTKYVISVSATTAENITDFSKIKGNNLLTENWMMGIISTLIGDTIMELVMVMIPIMPPPPFFCCKAVNRRYSHDTS